MKKRRRTIAIITLVVFVGTTLLYFPDRNVYATAFSGSCGPNMTWELETSTGELIIKGTGEMTSHPWNGGLNMYPKNVVIEEGVTSVCPEAFSNCRAIVSVTLPSTVRQLGGAAFDNCVSLKSITLPRGLSKISSGTFQGCSSLESLELPLGITFIGSWAFYNSGLKDLWIPGSVTEIESYAFRDCDSLQEINVATTNKNYTSQEGILYTKDMTSLVWFPSASPITNYEIPATVTKLEYGAICGCENLSKLIITKKIEVKKGSDVRENFAHCPLLKSLGPIGSGCAIEIGWTDEIQDEFEYGLFEKVIIPDGVKKIGCSAFSGFNLKKLIIPESVDDIEEYAYRSDNLVSAGPIGSGANIEFGWKDSIPSIAFKWMDSLKEVEVTDGITHIGDYAFVGCENLETVKLPESLKTIGRNAFAACESLEKIDLPKGLETINYSAFSDTALKEVVLPSGLKYIDGAVFSYCTSLEKVTIPLSVKEIRGSAFFDAPLTDVYYEGTEEEWENIVLDYGNEALELATIHFNHLGDTSEVHGDFVSGSKKFGGNQGFYYKDLYFDKPSTEYNHSLATMSLCLAFSAYGAGSYTDYDKNVKNVMKRCGFSKDYRYISFDFNEKPTKSSIACAIGAKNLNDKETLIAVAVRGGGYEKEWSNNFDLGKSSDHKGFDESSDTIVEYIKSYVVQNRIEGNVKIWITGFSRGSAVATHTAAKLNSAGEWAYPKNDGSYAKVSFDKEDIYGYGFATPAGASKDSEPESEKYNNIFHVIEFNDVVPLVAPSDWGFSRYGTTYILPYREGNDPLAFSSYIGTLKARMGDEYKVDSMKVSYQDAFFTENKLMTLGSYNRKITSMVFEQMDSRDTYVNKYQYILTAAMADENVDIVDAFIKVIDLIPWGNLLSGGIITTIKDNATNMAETHANQKYYVYWMQLMDSNYSNSMPVLWGSKEYRAVIVDGASEIKVYDGISKLVARITDSGETMTTTLVSGINENGSKVAYLPVDSDYTIDIEAGSAGEVSYRVEEYNTESGNNSRAVSYSVPDVKSGTTMQASVAGFSESELEEGAVNGSSVDYTFSSGSDEMTPDYDVTGGEIAERTYDVLVSCNSEQGSATGSGRYIEGSAVQLMAENKVGYDFIGFYVNGKRLNDGDPDGNKYTVTVKVTGNINVTAEFAECTHKWGNYETILEASCNSGGYVLKSCTKCGQQSYDYPSRLSHEYKNTTVKADAVKKKNGSITKTCSLCGNKIKTIIYYPKTVTLSKTAYEYNGSVRKPDVKVLNSKGNVIAKSNYSVTYQKGRKNVGQYKVTVTFKGNYKGKVEKSFTIKPKATSLGKVTSPGKKQIKATWQKRTVQVTGYELQYSTTNNFTKKTTGTLKVKSFKTNTKTINKLKSKKKYWIKVRAYKTVNGKTYYSAWSKAKTVKVK